eukprot:CAMPEP_0181314632 /NCGR_PEP_ID=MMETSP1101-20121128/14926_1 /TAXON_ID=46948 /ORGANISM="Rhodomonas abbreviata, Strain Caron Lab Isolate" /LENGTH=208 /DNA_ID=CAMNT_0023421747 /DNA_START=119 /DNA_END=745 /DNA_ORIENTATION=+
MGRVLSFQESGTGGLNIFWTSLALLLFFMVTICSFLVDTTGPNDTLPQYETAKGDPNIQAISSRYDNWYLASSLAGAPLQDNVDGIPVNQASSTPISKRPLAKSVSSKLGKYLSKKSGIQSNLNDDVFLKQLHSAALLHLSGSAAPGANYNAEENHNIYQNAYQPVAGASYNANQNYDTFQNAYQPVAGVNQNLVQIANQNANQLNYN